jgi:hypothetical protein
VYIVHLRFPNFFVDPSLIGAMTGNIRDVMEWDHLKVFLEVGGIDRPLLPWSSLRSRIFVGGIALALFLPAS